jgi:hypothetical protein
MMGGPGGGSRPEGFARMVHARIVPTGRHLWLMRYADWCGRRSKKATRPKAISVWKERRCNAYRKIFRFSITPMLRPDGSLNVNDDDTAIVIEISGHIRAHVIDSDGSFKEY